MTTTPAKAEHHRSILFAVQGTGAHVDVVRALVQVDEEVIAITPLGDNRHRLIFDPIELRTALNV